MAGWSVLLQAGAVVLVLALACRPLGLYMARVYTSDRDLGVERLVYRVIGVSPRAEQSWMSYLRAVLAFSLVSVLALYLLQRIQQWLPFSNGHSAVEPGVAFNTAVSFATNTNWQSYTPEETLGHTVQFAGLAVQNFVSAAVGIAVAVALSRGLAARGTQTLGNFWVDLVRGCFRVLLPLALIGAVALLACGVIQNFRGIESVASLAGGVQGIPGGPVASQEAIKELGTNGGGFFNANSAHPFENPNGTSNLIEVLLILLIPFSLPFAYGRIVGQPRQGRAVLAVMAVLALASLSVMALAETGAFNAGASGGVHGSASAAGAAMEGKETRFGVPGSVVFATATTLTSTGAVDAMHDSLTPIGGLMAMLNMMLGEIAPGGVGSGLYGLLVIAIITVFVAGLLVGRTPEYLGKKIRPKEMTMASLYILVMPILVLAGTALSFGIPALRASIEDESLSNTGPHGLSEVVYAFTSAANNNGSAFAGLTADTPWLATALGCAMLLGRFIPIALVLALAGSLATQHPAAETAGTLPTHRPLFIGITCGVALLVSALVFFPVLALGPLAEGL